MATIESLLQIKPRIRKSFQKVLDQSIWQSVFVSRTDRMKGRKIKAKRLR